MSRPEITVVVPTYKRPELLPRLVAALEAQTLDHSRFEVIVVDDCSGDDTAATLETLRAETDLDLRPLSTPRNSGPATARNVGWRNARAPFVAFTDDDCVPEPDWLEVGLRALVSDDRVGVVQGCTLRPRGEYEYTNWTVYREVTAPSPWFEGCNLFFRRDALAATGGFDENFRRAWGEDTAAGWAVLHAGWERGFAKRAVVRHDLVERGVRWHIRMGYREGDVLGITARYPAMRDMFWRRWALRRLNVAFAIGVLGTLAAVWRPVALVLWFPWFWWRKPPFDAPHWLRYLGERFAVDAAVFAGMKVAAIKYRQGVL